MPTAEIIARLTGKIGANLPAAEGLRQVHAINNIASKATAIILDLHSVTTSFLVLTVCQCDTHTINVTNSKHNNDNNADHVYQP